jgi:hypothetical protein
MKMEADISANPSLTLDRSSAELFLATQQAMHRKESCEGTEAIMLQACMKAFIPGGSPQCPKRTGLLKSCCTQLKMQIKSDELLSS